MIGTPCNDNDSCSVNDAIDNYCYCHGIENRRFVTNANNTGPGSLREAITTACNGDTIQFLSTVTDTIRLSSGITTSKSLVLQGQVNQDIVISGQLQNRILKINTGGQLTLSRLTLYGGKETTDGGAVLNDGTLILENAQFKKNFQGSIPKAWTNHGLISVKVGTNYVRLN